MTKTKKSQKNWLTYMKSWDGVVNPTVTDRQAAVNLIELQSIFQALAGVQRKIKEATINVVFFSYNMAAGYLFAVSTEGTFNTTVDLTTSTLNEALDTAINDAFGAERISGMQAVKSLQYNSDDSSAYGNFFIKVKVPPHVIQKWNEFQAADSEKSITIGAVLNLQGTSQVTYNATIEIRYVEEMARLDIH